MIGPINGEINIAPIITAVELTLSPIEAITMAHAKIHRLEPLNDMLAFTLSSTLCLSSSPALRFV